MTDSRRLPGLIASLVVAGSILFPLANVRAQPQEPANAAAKVQTPAVNYRERPRFPFDPQRLKRRPTLDGIIAENEWDPLYTVSGLAVNGTVYANWDDEYLYLAAKTDAAAWVIFDVDANGDGWLRGADNLEIALSPQSDTAPPAITARILDAASSKDTPVWNEKVVDPNSIKMAAKMIGASSVIEIAIPRGIAGIVPRANGTLGVRGDFLPAAATPLPTQPYEPHLLLDIKLVESVVVSAPGLAPRLTLEDDKLIPGQSLKATLDLLGQTDEETHVKAVTWKGEGAAGDILRLVREPNVPSFTARKPAKLKYSSGLPDTAVPGFYQMTCMVELEGGRMAAATKSFTVVEPFVLKVVPQSDSVTIGDQQTRTKINVEVSSAVPGYARGDVELEVPGGWVVEGRKKKSFEVPREDATSKSPFFITFPPASQPGDYLVHATLSWRGKTWKTHTTIHINKTGATEPAKPLAKPSS